ncbi:MAG: beta-galactosidase trimerization domain-containing protein [Candidatus Omnitrophota bacterium]
MKRILLLFCLLIFAGNRNLFAISDSLPGSAWLDASGKYATGTQRIISIQNDYLTVNQWVGATNGYLTQIEILENSSGRIIFSTDFLQEWSLNENKLGYYAIPAGGLPEAVPRYENIANRGGIFFWDWNTGQWLVWSNKTNQPDPDKTVSFPAGMPDFKTNAFKESFRWKYVLQENFTARTEIILEMKKGVPAVKVTVLPDFCFDFNIKAKLKFPSSEVESAEVNLGADKPRVFFLPSSENSFPEAFFFYLEPSSFASQKITGAKDSFQMHFGDTGNSPAQSKKIIFYVGLAENDYGKISTVEKAIEPLRKMEVISLISQGERIVFNQGEEITWTLSFPKEFAGEILNLELGGKEKVLLSETKTLPENKDRVSFLLPTRFLAPGRYRISAILKSKTGESATASHWFSLAPESDPGTFPVQTWFHGTPMGLETFRKLSTVFNRFLVFSDQLPGYVDTAALQNSKICVGLTPAQPSWWESSPNSQELRNGAARHSRLISERFSDFPAVDMVDIYSEKGNRPAKDADTLERMHREIGLKEFPVLNWQKGIIPDSDPYLRYCLWWDKEGGVPNFLGFVATAIKESVPQISAGHSEGFMAAAGNYLYAPGLWERLDFLFKWTYTLPDPKLIAFASECLRSAARKDQRVCSNIQLLWKKDWIEPGRHYTINADILRETTWLSMGRGVDILSYWPHFFLTKGSEFKEQGVETVTCPEELWEEMKSLKQDLFLPYGYFCSQMKRPLTSTGLLYSVTEEIGSGWKHQEDAAELWYQLAQAHIPTEIVYEENIIQGDLSRYQTLVLPKITYMRESVLETLKKFADGGGIILTETELPFLPQTKKIPQFEGSGDQLLKKFFEPGFSVKPDDVKNWQTTPNINLSAEDGKIKLTENDTVGYGAAYFSVSADLTQYPVLKISVLKSEGKWSLQVEDFGALAPETDATGVFTYDLGSLTGWKGKKNFKLYIYEAGRGKSLWIESLEIGRITATPEVMEQKAKESARQQKIAFFRGEFLKTDGTAPFADTENPEVVLTQMERGQAKYVLLVNDQRTFGNWVGQFKNYREKGVDQEITLKVNEKNFFAYDLQKHQKLNFQPGDRLKIDLPAGGGKILAFYPREIASVKLKIPGECHTGTMLKFGVEVNDKEQKKIAGIQPLSLTLTKANGETATLYRTAGEGFYEGEIVVADNEPCGKWKMSATELGSGVKTAAEFNVMQDEIKTSFNWR